MEYGDEDLNSGYEEESQDPEYEEEIHEEILEEEGSLGCTGVWERLSERRE